MYFGFYFLSRNKSSKLEEEKCKETPKILSYFHKTSLADPEDVSTGRTILGHNNVDYKTIWTILVF